MSPTLSLSLSLSRSHSLFLSLSLSLSQFTDFPLTCKLGFFHVLPNWNLLSGGGGVAPGVGG